jgi:hypothetical protein
MPIAPCPTRTSEPVGDTSGTPHGVPHVSAHTTSPTAGAMSRLSSNRPGHRSAAAPRAPAATATVTGSPTAMTAVRPTANAATVPYQLLGAPRPHVPPTSAAAGSASAPTKIAAAGTGGGSHETNAYATNNQAAPLGRRASETRKTGTSRLRPSRTTGLVSRRVSTRTAAAPPTSTVAWRSHQESSRVKRTNAVAACSSGRKTRGLTARWSPRTAPGKRRSLWSPGMGSPQ